MIALGNRPEGGEDGKRPAQEDSAPDRRIDQA